MTETGRPAAWESEQHRKSRATRAQRLLIDRLLARRPRLAMWIRPRLNDKLTKGQASALIDWLRAGGKGDAPELGDAEGPR